MRGVKGFTLRLIRLGVAGTENPTGICRAVDMRDPPFVTVDRHLSGQTNCVPRGGLSSRLLSSGDRFGQNA